MTLLYRMTMHDENTLRSRSGNAPASLKKLESLTSLKMEVHFETEPLTLRFLRTFRELLRFVLFTYTVLFGALILAGWTTYFIVAK
ncbi:hypothetical protein SRHO_G00261270 [Serrasalmus rhombeus]